MGYDDAFFRSLRALGATAGPGDDWLDRDTHKPLYGRPSSVPCRQVVLVTKWPWLSWILPAGVLPQGVSAYHVPGFLPASQVGVLRREAAATGLPVHFIGDLDPCDLTLYLTLALGGFGHETSNEPPLDMRYLGVGDPWIAICRKHWMRARDPLRLPTIRLRPFEVRQLAWLDAQDVDWTALVGPESMALLREGWKLEIEGASNPAFYSERFPSELRTFMIGEGGETSAAGGD